MALNPLQSVRVLLFSHTFIYLFYTIVIVESEQHYNNKRVHKQDKQGRNKPVGRVLLPAPEPLSEEFGQHGPLQWTLGSKHTRETWCVFPTELLGLLYFRR